MGVARVAMQARERGSLALQVERPAAPLISLCAQLLRTHSTVPTSHLAHTQEVSAHHAPKHKKLKSL